MLETKNIIQKNTSIANQLYIYLKKIIKYFVMEYCSNERILAREYSFI